MNNTTGQSGTRSAQVAAGLRAWARGSYADEAAVELLLRSFAGRYADDNYPWIRSKDRPGSYWLDGAAITHNSGALSGGERRLLSVVAALVDGHPVHGLGDLLAGMDRRHLELVLAALSHAGGSHQHFDLRELDGGGYRIVELGALVPWPAAGSGADGQDRLPLTIEADQPDRWLVATDGAD